MRINVGCGQHYADGWVNLDLVRDNITRPDVLVTTAVPFPFETASVEKAYLGHVLEHIAWEDVPIYLSQLRRVLKPGASALFVGPDVRRTIQQFAEHRQSFDRVLATLENVDEERYARLGSHHRWNCHEERLFNAVVDAGFIAQVVTLEEVTAEPWPLVDTASDQMAVMTWAPS